MKSWKTTAGGALALIAVLAQQGSNYLDSNPATVFEVGSIVAAVMLFVSLWNARDKNVSSEDEGIR